MSGLFITFEGPEGSGKSTHAARLADRLAAAGYPVLRTREPGGTPTGEVIRDILQHDTTGEPLAPETELLLFSASRAQLVRRVIRPALERGEFVVCDRFADSTTAYQGYGRGFDIEQVLALNAWALGGTDPDITVLLDLPVSCGFERLRARNEARGHTPDRFEREAVAFHERVREGYLDLARRFPGRIRVVPSEGNADAVHDAVWAAVAARLEPATPETGVDDDR